MSERSSQCCSVFSYYKAEEGVLKMVEGTLNEGIFNP